MVRLPIICTLSLLSVVVSAQYQMVKEYAGPSFFNDWNFYANYDNLTNGDVNYLSAKDAQSQQLAYINSRGNAIMKVDNTSTVKFPDKRNSIRINSKDRYTIGTLWVADMLHAPWGVSVYQAFLHGLHYYLTFFVSCASVLLFQCSVWPAFWSSAPTWPDGGEIDTFEGVNQVTMNQMGLHTAPGCSHTNTSLQTSTLINSTDCSIYANSNEGCIITNPTTKSYGAGFAQAGGGIYVTEFAAHGISIWFFTRSSIPDALQGNASSIDPASLGSPVATWNSDGCDITQSFEPQSLIFDISLCGDYAGNSNSFYQTCTGVCYQDWVLGNPSNYDNAYFEVQYVRVYGQPGELTVIHSGDALRSSASFVGLMFTAVAFSLLALL
ncbi:hypothetical protein BXZ70DRAFT_555950 [Cristinia sonorae]|uniref:GH16 domain-containing protein n=1 Tax=Cristinia sonorae TaxID=1940300 RepID=A0A8K0UFP6_9AGAR|nr:hypothetical protein BXZ70DRAFT_555950 [Cristinia sonorae]